MRYRKLDISHDYTFGRRDEFHSGAHAVAQAIRTRLLLLLGEWWEDTEDGLPLYQKITGRPFGDEDKLIADKEITERILGTAGVRELAQYSSRVDYATRGMTAECAVRTDEGGLITLAIGGGSAPAVRIKEVARWPT
jgi:hypothetical protein